MCWMSQQEAEKSIFRVIFRVDFDIMTVMIVQSTISRFNLFWIESFDSGLCYFGELRKQICWMLQQGTEKNVFRVIFWIGFGIRTEMILQNTISRFNLFRFESFDSGECYSTLENYENKRSKEHRIAFSELSFELALALGQQWFCKTLFPDSTYFDWKFWYLSVLLWRATKRKNLLNVAARNRDEHFQSYLSN